MIDPNRESAIERCECGDAIEHSPAAHHELEAAIAAAELAAEMSRQTTTATKRWLAVVRRLVRSEG